MAQEVTGRKGYSCYPKELENMWGTQGHGVSGFCSWYAVETPGHSLQGWGCSLVRLHVHSAADDDLQEELSPLCSLLGTTLYCVKHAPHLPGPQISQIVQGDKYLRKV